MRTGSVGARSSEGFNGRDEGRLGRRRRRSLLGNTAADLLPRDGTRKEQLLVPQGQDHERENGGRSGEPRSSVVGTESAAEPVSWGLSSPSDLGVGVLRRWRAGVIQENVGSGQPEPAAQHDTGENRSAKSSGQSAGFHARDSISSAPPR